MKNVIEYHIGNRECQHDSGHNHKYESYRSNPSANFVNSMPSIVNSAGGSSGDYKAYVGVIKDIVVWKMYL